MTTTTTTTDRNWEAFKAEAEAERQGEIARCDHENILTDWHGKAVGCEDCGGTMEEITGMSESEARAEAAIARL